MFLPVSFKPSATVADMADGVAGTLESLSQEFAQGAAALGSLGLPESGPGDLAEAMGKLRDAAGKALASPVNFMAVTLFLSGVGTRKGEQGYLTPGQALSFLAGRFAEAGDDAEGKDAIASRKAEQGELGSSPRLAEEGENGLVVLMIAAQTQKALGEALGAFNAVYPIPDLERAARRAKALATLELDKFVTPKAPGFPPWTAINPQKNATGQAFAKALGGMVAAGEGAAKAATAPGAMLAGFARKQAAKLAQKKAELEKLAASMAGGMDSWLGVYVQGKGPEIFRELAKLAPPFDDSFKSSSLMCFYGKPETVAFFRESFGLCKRTLGNPLCLICPGGRVPEEWNPVDCPDRRR